MNQYQYHLSLLFYGRLLLWSPSSGSSLSSERVLNAEVFWPLNASFGPACGTSTIRSLFLVPLCVPSSYPVSCWHLTTHPWRFCLSSVFTSDSWHWAGEDVSSWLSFLFFFFFHVDIYTYSIAYVKWQPWGPGIGKRKDGVYIPVLSPLWLLNQALKTRWDARQEKMETKRASQTSKKVQILMFSMRFDREALKSECDKYFKDTIPL